MTDNANTKMRRIGYRPPENVAEPDELVLVEYVSGGRVAIITLNRPHADNAVTTELAAQLIEVLDTIAARPTVRVAILTGAGDRAFSVGGDLYQRKSMTKEEWLRQRQVFDRVLYNLRRLRRPIFTAVNGMAYGGGCEIAISTDFIIASSRHNQISVASYPSIFQGCHWGRCSANSSMPLRVIQIKSAPFSWSVSNRSSGIWNAAAEAWFSPIPDSSHGYYGGAELMIWLDRQVLQPAGEKVGRVFIGGAWWDVWYAKMSHANLGWNYIAYEREVPTDSIQLDLMDFINDSLSRGYINRSWYLHNLQAGFEIQAGGEGLTSHSFSVLINGGEENGTEAFTSPPPFKCMKRFRAIKQARIGQHI